MKQVFLNYQNIEINLLAFIANLLIAFLLSYILSLVYVKYGNSLSNKKYLVTIFI